MKLKITSPIVSVEWLYKNLEAQNVIILDATIQKVGTTNEIIKEKQQIPNAVFFDLQQVFLDKKGEYPNTIPTQEIFEKEVQKLGINKDSCIVVYDDLGVYSSPRVWWLFKVFGFENIAVLNGGLPEWIKNNLPVETPMKREVSKGNFKVVFNKELITETKEVVQALSTNIYILDARSKGRFYATSPEPRADLRGGHIPSSINLPHTELQFDNLMKTPEELEIIFSEINPKYQEMIFTCGSGITACILALGAEITGRKKYKVYDGSWTEWASRLELPIEK